MNFQELLDRLEGVRPSGKGWMARCPAHEDRQPSLSVADGGDRLLLHCFGACPAEVVLSALGLTFGDLFPTDGRPTARGTVASSSPQALWATVRRELRDEDPRLAEGEVANAIRRAHQRAGAIRQAATALQRRDDGALDLLASATALERTASTAEAALDEMRAEEQAAAFARRRG